MSRVTLTINLELSIPGLPPQGSAKCGDAARRKSAAARVFVNGDLGGRDACHRRHVAERRADDVRDGRRTSWANQCDCRQEEEDVKCAFATIGKASMKTMKFKQGVDWMPIRQRENR